MGPPGEEGKALVGFGLRVEGLRVFRVHALSFREALELAGVWG